MEANRSEVLQLSAAPPPSACHAWGVEHAFHPGEGFADALAWAAAKGKVGKLRSRGLGFRRLALRIKLFWIRVVTRINAAVQGRHSFPLFFSSHFSVQLFPFSISLPS
jgi:hypothetical protein